MLTHFVIVRRDLPLGKMAAMVTHAAGESGARYDDPERGGFQGCRAVVLEARDEVDLIMAQKQLQRNSIEDVSVYESDPPYSGQLMAIGLVPVESTEVEGVTRSYSTLKVLVDKAGESIDYSQSYAEPEAAS